MSHRFRGLAMRHLEGVNRRQTLGSDVNFCFND